MSTLFDDFSADLSDDWFCRLDHLPLSEVVTVVMIPCHLKLKKVADRADGILACLDSKYFTESFDLKVYAWARKRFFHFLRLHLENEVRDVFLPFDNEGNLPDQQSIRLMRFEHNRLVEALDFMSEALEHLQSKDAEQLAGQKQARDCIARLDSMLNAEILAEERGILRRCAAYRRDA